VESLKAQEEMQRYELEAAYITLASNVVAAAIQEASTRAQIEATERIVDASSKALDILQRQQKLGYASNVDLASQESALAQAQLALPPLRKQLEQTRDLIRALVGNLPNKDVAQTFELSAISLPGDLPLSLPSAIIRQRPDVRAAEEQMRSANAEIGVAVAARLPQFSISGAYGGAATQLDQVFKAGGPFWNLTGNIDQTIFAGFTLQHRQRVADQAFIQAAAQYRSTVVSAFQNVADTLHALESDAETLKAAASATDAAKKTLDLTTRQYDVGYANSLALFSAEQAYRQAVIGLVQAQANRLSDSAALFVALGGGWWNRPNDPNP
jgi:NodT family efflux transporter outer membrane factor (OMF) lipoprotein